MKTLFMECSSGLAGDMILSSLIDTFEDKDSVMEELNAIGIPNVKYSLEQSVKCGIVGSHVRVFIDGQEEGNSDPHDHHHEEHDHHHEEHDHHHEEHDHHHEEHDHHHVEHDHHHEEHDHHHDHTHHHHGHDHAHHHHAGMDEISSIIHGLSVSDAVKSHALSIYQLIAEAESKVHGRSVTEIHFHEVGTKDAIADIVGACYLIEKIAPERIVASPIVTGYGHVKCAHGILPVPAPATALLLSGIPSFAGKEAGEHCTPTGVAVMKHFADDFSERPLMNISHIGYGMGTRDFKFANCVRAFVCEE